MTTRTEAKPWDLSHVLDLVNSLSSKDVTASDYEHERLALRSPLYEMPKSLEQYDSIAAQDFGITPSKLGDFGRIWQYLGSPLDSPVPEVPPLTSEPAVTGTLPVKLDYTSDGAAYVRPAKSGKGVSWQAEGSAEEPVTDTATDRSVSPELPKTPTLTKAQRKKQRRKERRAQEAAEAVKNATVSESEAGSTKKKTPARKASSHLVPASDAYTRYDLRERDASGNAVTASAAPTVPTSSAPALEPSIELATSRVAKKLAEMKRVSPRTPTKAPATRTNQAASSARQQSQPISTPKPQRTVSACDTLHSRPTQQWPVTTPANAKATQLVPSSVQPPAKSAAISILKQPSLAVSPNTPPVVGRKHVIEPRIVRSGEDRHWALLMKLIADFWVDRKYLISPMNLTTHNNDPNGLHVFVDASNIFIGFQDQLKRSRGIPWHVQVPEVNLSFDALALLMERRRPVAKRVLVGSTPHLPAFDKAKAVGYECSILEKVYKAKELTERQIYFNTYDKYGRVRKNARAPPANNVITANGSPPKTVTTNGYSSGGNGSGSETTANAPQFAKARMIEQGVDEILHLKMMESVVDTDTPSTIVLATGDAAQAEYSDGFMRMVERALKKGWKVELVSWSKNISMMYSRREWTQTWAENFRVIYLDDYAEELLEM